MNRRSVGTTLIMLLLLFAAGALAWRAVGTPGIVRAQQASATSATPTTQQQTTPQASSQQEAAPPAAPQAPPQQSPTGTSLKAETREVRVDVVVTDKKGNYVEDLKTSDFRLYEDDKQQPINSFSFGADPKGPIESQRHYMVLFFDNSSMDLSDQPRARAAAGKFIDAYAGPDRVMAVVNFGGSLQFAQNFTMDATRLKQAVSGISTSALASNPTASNSGNIANSPGGGPINADSSMSGLQSGMPSLGNAEGNFAAYTLLLSVRQLAKSLASIPGRKSLILFTAGFELDPERFSELTATIDACNKANVAVYPLDVRGLTTAVADAAQADATEHVPAQRIRPRIGLERGAAAQLFCVRGACGGGNFNFSAWTATCRVSSRSLSRVSGAAARRRWWRRGRRRRSRRRWRRRGRWRSRRGWRHRRRWHRWRQRRDGRWHWRWHRRR